MFVVPQPGGRRVLVQPMTYLINEEPGSNCLDSAALQLLTVVCCCVCCPAAWRQWCAGATHDIHI